MTDTALNGILEANGDRGDIAAAVAIAEHAALPAIVTTAAGELIATRDPIRGIHLYDPRHQLEASNPHPSRAEGTVTFRDVDSFSRYVHRHATDATVVYHNRHADPQAVAVIDDHTPDEPGWGQHRALLHLRHSPEWQAWTHRQSRTMDQVEFADFVEDHLYDIAEPDGATLLEIITSIQGHRNVEFTKGIRLADGNLTFAYTEETTATAGARGDLTIPERFTLALRPYEGTDPVAVTARFRWRLRDGALALSYILDELDRILEDTFSAQVVGQLEEDLLAPVLYGTPRGQ